MRSRAFSWAKVFATPAISPTPSTSGGVLAVRFTWAAGYTRPGRHAPLSYTFAYSSAVKLPCFPPGTVIN